ncbi:MAG: FKBP-type peptidyl-prolyl cis-trans isomerase [Ginsengibacter sp.]
MIKNMLFGLCVASFIFSSCVKNNKCGYTSSTITAPDAEVQAVNDSLHNHQIFSATQDPSGFYYIIDNAGSGAFISNLCSNVSVSYKGTYFNGNTFDSTAANQVATFQLGQVIVGWQKGLPLISKGGHITLYVPPSLAYGSSPVTDNLGNVIVPGNSYLVFDITLVDVQ